VEVLGRWRFSGKRRKEGREEKSPTFREQLGPGALTGIIAPARVMKETSKKKNIKESVKEEKSRARSPPPSYQ